MTAPGSKQLDHQGSRLYVYCQNRELKIQTFSGRRRRGKRLRLGWDWPRMRPRRRSYVGDVRSVGLPSRWKRELILFVFLTCCQFCRLYWLHYHISHKSSHVVSANSRDRLFSLLVKWLKQYVPQWSPNCRSKFWTFTCIFSHFSFPTLHSLISFLFSLLSFLWLPMSHVPLSCSFIWQ